MEKEICRNCTYYNAYYHKYSVSYGQLDHGRCRKHQKGSKYNETCEEYKSNESKERSREKRILQQLGYALDSINDIAAILKERKK